MSWENEQFVVVDQRKLPLLVDAKIISDASTDVIDISVFICIVYYEPDVINDTVIQAISDRLDVSKDDVIASVERLSDMGLLYEEE